jgi:hypothetical protein
MIKLVSMTAEEARSWLAESERDYGAESRGLTHDEALARAQGMLREILPRHEATTGAGHGWGTGVCDGCPPGWSAWRWRFSWISAFDVSLTYSCSRRDPGQEDG